MPDAPLRFVEHDDVVFERAPLEVVLCQIRFPPIFALMESAGVAGFQTAVRREYPVTSADQQVDFKVGAGQAEVKQKAPVWRMQDESSHWTVSANVGFIALETPKYSRFEEFQERLEFVLAAADRTLQPSRTTRVGLRKVNNFEHPDIEGIEGWGDLLQPEVMGLAGGRPTPGNLRSSFTQLEVKDESGGTLTVRFGVNSDSPRRFRLDLDYWTKTPFAVKPDSKLVERLEMYSKSITSFFHWAIKPSLYDYLEPRPREG